MSAECIDAHLLLPSFSDTFFFLTFFPTVCSSGIGDKRLVLLPLNSIHFSQVTLFSCVPLNFFYLGCVSPSTLPHLSSHFFPSLALSSFFYSSTQVPSSSLSIRELYESLIHNPEHFQTNNNLRGTRWQESNEGLMLLTAQPLHPPIIQPPFPTPPKVSLYLVLLLRR